jgi:hypothetical protein
MDSQINLRNISPTESITKFVIGYPSEMDISENADVLIGVTKKNNSFQLVKETLSTQQVLMFDKFSKNEYIYAVKLFTNTNTVLCTTRKNSQAFIIEYKASTGRKTKVYLNSNSTFNMSIQVDYYYLASFHKKFFVVNTKTQKMQTINANVFAGNNRMKGMDLLLLGEKKNSITCWLVCPFISQRNVSFINFEKYYANNYKDLKIYLLGRIRCEIEKLKKKRKGFKNYRIKTKYYEKIFRKKTS